MKRAMLVALGTGAIITSAAGITIGGGGAIRGAGAEHSPFERARIEQAARADQRERVETRYLAARARCDDVVGVKRDDCLISAHARRGLALLEIQAPYAR
jgi:hypothetical protein